MVGMLRRKVTSGNPCQSKLRLPRLAGTLDGENKGGA